MAGYLCYNFYLHVFPYLQERKNNTQKYLFVRCAKCHLKNRQKMTRWKISCNHWAEIPLTWTLLCGESSANVILVINLIPRTYCIPNIAKSQKYITRNQKWHHPILRNKSFVNWGSLIFWYWKVVEIIFA